MKIRVVTMGVVLSFVLVTLWISLDYRNDSRKIEVVNNFEIPKKIPIEKQAQKPNVKIEMVEVKVEEWVSLGEFTITAYCPCEKCCGKCDGITKTGTIATQGRTIAVDPNVIEYGTTVMIDGNEYVAEDCGGAIKGNHIDVYFDSHDEALEFGIQKAEVLIKNESTIFVVANSTNVN